MPGVDNAQMTIEEIKAVVAAAHDYGFTVAAHAHGAEAIRRAVIGGVDSIEHGTFMDDADMKLMKEHGTWYVPTIIAGKYVAEMAAKPGYYPAQNKSQKTPQQGPGGQQAPKGRGAHLKEPEPPDSPAERRVTRNISGRRLPSLLSTRFDCFD